MLRMIAFSRCLKLSCLPALLAAGALALLVPLQADAQSRKQREKERERTEEKAAAPAPAAAEPAQAEPDAWAVNCTNQVGAKFACEMTQNIIDQQSRGQVMLISVKSVASGGSSAMLFRVFHGVYIPAGVGVNVDKGHPTKVQFQKSDQLGVYAALPLDEKWTGEMRKGRELRISLEVNQGQPLEIVARLQGFGKALDKVRTIE